MPYDAKYILKSKIRDTLVEGDQKLRVSGEALDDLYKYFDDAIEKAANELIGALPRKSKGEHKGELKRITITPEDLKQTEE